MNHTIESKRQGDDLFPRKLTLTAISILMMWVIPLSASAAASISYLERNAATFADEAKKKYGEMINVAALLHDYDPNLLLAIIVVESEGQKDAKSNKGARGLMQLMPGTAKAMGAKDPNEPFQNILAGTKYLRALEREYGFDSTKDALVAYNMGPTRAKRWLSQYSSDDYIYVERVTFVQQMLDQRDEIARNESLASVAGSDTLHSSEARPLMTRPRSLSLASLPFVLPANKREVESTD